MQTRKAVTAMIVTILFTIVAWQGAEASTNFGVVDTEEDCRQLAIEARLSWYSVTPVIGSRPSPVQCMASNRPIELSRPRAVGSGAVTGRKTCRQLCEYPNCEPNAVINAFLTLSNDTWQVRMQRNQSGSTWTFGNGSCTGTIDDVLTCPVTQNDGSIATLTVKPVGTSLVAAYDRRISNLDVPVFNCRN